MSGGVILRLPDLSREALRFSLGWLRPQRKQCCDFETSDVSGSDVEVGKEGEGCLLGGGDVKSISSYSVFRTVSGS